MTTDRTSRRAQKTPRGARKDDARLRFAGWIATPDIQRNPKTQKELARVLGVAASTLSEWRRLPMVEKLVGDWRERYQLHFQEVMEAMHRQARRGNVPAARLIAEVLGQLAPSKSITAQGSLSDFLSTAKWTDEAKPATRLRAISGGKAAAK